MFGLMLGSYGNVFFETFQDDLKKKDTVILLFEGETLCGFSTQVLLPFEFDGQRLRVVFSGDTIVAASHRTSLALPVAWGRMMLDILAQTPDLPLYWLLTSKGFRTYRFLSVFFENYTPHYKKSASPFEKELIQTLGRSLFAERFDAERGILRAGPSSQFLLHRQDREGNGGARRDPAIAFFEARNPGAARGDELVCIARFAADNLKPYILRQLQKR